MERAQDHIPVMMKEVVHYLQLKPNGCYVDCTLGLGGHSGSVIQHLKGKAQIIAVDRDKDSLEKAKENLSAYSKSFKFVHDNFRNIDKILNQLNVSGIDGMIFDLGISSFQLDNPQRGFSLNAEGPLDMRMDQESCLSAYDLVNTLSEQKISSILKDYGEERLSKRIARTIVSVRSQQPLESTKQLCEVVLRALPPQSRRQKIHPATRTFQALRIAVNRELDALQMALDKCLPYLKAGGRMCLISFHSLEDRIVKQTFRSMDRQGQVKLIVKKPVRPSEDETQHNPRARSARLRVIERI